MYFLLGDCYLTKDYHTGRNNIYYYRPISHHFFNFRRVYSLYIYYIHISTYQCQKYTIATFDRNNSSI